MKIGIFTPNTLNPIHARLEMTRNFLLEAGYEVEILNYSLTNSFWRIMNWLSLWYLDIYAISKLKKEISKFDLIIVQDFRLFPLLKKIKKQNKIAIYEVIDNFAHIQYTRLIKRNFLFKYLKNVRNYFQNCEKKYARKYASSIIVNSKALNEYFDYKAEIIYYASPFETMEIENDANKPLAFLYVGGFTIDKGSIEILNICKNTAYPLFIFGSTDEPSKLALQSAQKVEFISMLPSNELKERLKQLFEKYFLIGFSLIKSVHYSYATQEANKDIDYLAMGIPFIGNHRLTTEDKILAGCGIFENDISNSKLFTDNSFRKLLSTNCRQYYQKYYSQHNYKNKLIKIIASYEPQTA